MRDTIIQAFTTGYEDRHLYGLLRVEQHYRRPLSNRIAWRLGWEVANVVTPTPLRTAKKPPGYKPPVRRHGGPPPPPPKPTRWHS